MLPMTVILRFDCVLAHTEEKVLASHAKHTVNGKLTNLATLSKIAKDACGRELGFRNHCKSRRRSGRFFQAPERTPLRPHRQIPLEEMIA